MTIDEFDALSERDKKKLLNRVKKKWPSCEGVRSRNGGFEFAIEATMGLHWVKIEVVPIEAALIVDPMHSLETREEKRQREAREARERRKLKEQRKKDEQNEEKNRTARRCIYV